MIKDKDINLHIITICFNDLLGLQRTYRSLQIQDNSRFNWYVIDGASKDGTSDWLESIEDNLKYWVSEKDGGIYDAMNKGIQFLDASNDDYVIFLNSGDELNNYEVISSFYEHISKRELNSSLIYGNSNHVGDGFSYVKMARKLGHYVYGMPTSHQAMFFKYDELKKHMYSLDYNLSSDYDLYCKFAKKLNYNDNYILDEIVCNFYLDGISNDKRLEGLLEGYKIRRTTCGLSIFKAMFIFVLQFIWSKTKEIIPKNIMKFWR